MALLARVCTAGILPARIGVNSPARIVVRKTRYKVKSSRSLEEFADPFVLGRKVRFHMLAILVCVHRASVIITPWISFFDGCDRRFGADRFSCFMTASSFA